MSKSITSKQLTTLLRQRGKTVNTPLYLNYLISLGKLEIVDYTPPKILIEVI